MALWGHRSEKVLRLTRRERKELRARAREDVEQLARVQRAQRRLAQATGPLPVIEPRASSEEPARRSAIVDQ